MEHSKHFFHSYRDWAMLNGFHLFYHNGSVSVVTSSVLSCITVFSAAFILSIQLSFLYTSATLESNPGPEHIT